MNKYKHNLIDLDVKKLFVEHKIDEIVEIQKLLDAEIERKRTELRSMVGYERFIFLRIVYLILNNITLQRSIQGYPNSFRLHQEYEGYIFKNCRKYRKHNFFL